MGKEMKKAVTSNLDISMCTGCAACVNVCPKNALTLAPDDLGYYRSTLNAELCIDCGICSNICPALSLPKNQNETSPACYAFVAADKNFFMKSSSGGAFPVFARETFKRNGKVVGASWKNPLTVQHIMIDSETDLPKLQKSKYLQSYIGDIYRKVKQELDNNVFVLFVGCPCQVTGLKAFLNKDYDNLLLVDIFCNHAPSQMFFQKFIQSSFPDGIKEFEFRYKSDDENFNDYACKITMPDDSSIVLDRPSENDYIRAFQNNVMTDTHCLNCKYQKLPRFGDLSIGDFWNDDYRERFAAEKGMSAMLVNNKKGQAFLDSIDPEDIKLMESVPLEALGNNGRMMLTKIRKKTNQILWQNTINEMTFSQSVAFATKPNHGIYAGIASENNMPLLSHDSNFLKFNFDPNIWEQHIINGKTTLVMVARNNYSLTRQYVTMQLSRSLEKDKSYTLNMRLKVKTNSNKIVLYLKDSGTLSLQAVTVFNVPDNSENKYIKIKKNFVPNSDIYDQIAFVSKQFKDNGSYIAFDYIYITET